MHDNFKGIGNQIKNAQVQINTFVSWQIRSLDRMMHELKGKVILITGAATGIGSKVVQIAVAEEAKHVAILDIAEEAGIAFQNELNTKYGNNKVQFIKCDVSNGEELNAAFAKVKNEFGYIDIVINNAGILNDNLQVYVKQIDINVTALVTSSLKALELMRKDEGGNGGVVINVSSVAAVCAVPDTPIYSATKAAVLKFTTAMGSDLYYSRTEVRFLTVCFGATNTPLLSVEKMGSFDSEVEAGIVETLKTLKWQSPESAARGVVDTYKNGRSGSVWLIAGGKPAIEVTDLYNKGFALFDHLVYN
ncbi:PREDICTED: 15-hydroxyprostaglandin dehydrogenase [NAD(+)]-like [Papilio polytes]|uniref:15-hydroxyprostaglandin dehydrogenase [NAD(+)]-like n=1 Tax=Papilio polytes TaxID=76194 RepID=UPI00067601BA|nr:PREDICTED: 15-hydroxyprostaglandin dehydrogenase [NAD(+)]-like [Papilio polytes]